MMFETLAPPIASGELMGPKFGNSAGNVTLTVQPSVSGRRYQLQCSDTMMPGSWQNRGLLRVGDGNNLVISDTYSPGVPKRFYRLVLSGTP